MIVTITGPSGVGKTTLYNTLRKRLSLTPLVSTTTRAPRPTDEAGGFEYVTDEEFDQLEKEGVFLWAVHPHGKKYGTRKAAVDQALTQNAISILVIDAVKKLHDYASKIVSFYIHIDDEAELRKRFNERGDMTSEEIESRMAECRSWKMEAEKSGIPFIYLDGKKSREEILQDALAHLSNR